MSEPNELIINSAGVISDYNGSDISCFGASDGIIEVNAFGGTEYNYTYSFLPDLAQNLLPPGSQINGLSAGSYSLQLFDDNQCLSNPLIVEVLSPTELTITDVTPVDVNCFGGSDGQLVIEGQGGTGAYTYLVDAQPYIQTDKPPLLFQTSFPTTLV